MKEPLHEIVSRIRYATEDLEHWQPKEFEDPSHNFVETTLVLRKHVDDLIRRLPRYE